MAGRSLRTHYVALPTVTLLALRRANIKGPGACGIAAPANRLSNAPLVVDCGLCSGMLMTYAEFARATAIVSAVTDRIIAEHRAEFDEIVETESVLAALDGRRHTKPAPYAPETLPLG